MGKMANKVRRTQRAIRPAGLSDAERAHLRASATYEGSPFHKRNPGDFGLTPPAAPRPDKTLCDEAGLVAKGSATALLTRAIEAGIVSRAEGAPGFPKELWVLDENGRVFEAMYGGSKTGAYHGYPVRKEDPFFDQIIEEWERRHATV